MTWPPLLLGPVPVPVPAPALLAPLVLRAPRTRARHGTPAGARTGPFSDAGPCQGARAIHAAGAGAHSSASQHSASARC